MPIDSYLLLSLADPRSAALESARHGSASGPSCGPYVRCLNSAGRWAVEGTDLAPLLVWTAGDASGAQAAARRASDARGLLVDVVSRSDERWVEGRQIRLFGDTSEAALVGYEALSAGRARRLRLEADKLEAFCLIVRAASAAPSQEAFADVGRAASKALQAKFGGGSITSAFAWLSGRAGQDAIDSVLRGEVELLGGLSLSDVAQAVALAKEAEVLQAQAHPSRALRRSP